MASAWGSSWGTSWSDSWGSISAEQALSANDITSASTVTTAAVGQLHVLLANDVSSASSVGHPTIGEVGAINANDVTAASSVTTAALGQVHVLAANDVASASSVTHTLVAQQQVLDAVNVTSASGVTTPTLVEEGEVIPPEPEPVPLPPTGGAGGVYRKAWQREFDRRRAREEGLTLRQYLDRIETTAKKGSAAEQAAIERSAKAVRQALEHEAFETGLAEIAALERILAATANLQGIALLVADMLAAEQAAQAMLQEAIALEEQRFQAELMEQMAYDDALATILLLMAP